MSRNKDPAFLFYPSDFIMGTMLMTDEEVGKYIRLLCLQHQQGHISEMDLTQICNGSQRVQSKFIKDSDGKYYNERLDAEINHRLQYSASRSINGKKGGRPPKETTEKPIENHMKTICLPYENHSENENIIRNIIEYLNSKLNTKYQYTSNYIVELVGARLEEGYVLQDFKTVIDKKYAEWSGTEFAKFLRPETLFGTKFSTYLNQLGAEVQEARYTSFSADDALEMALQRAYEK